MKKDDIRQLAQAYGWADRGPQKNKHMLSFNMWNRVIRMNVYYTTMTVTIQSIGEEISVYKYISTPEKFEELLMQLEKKQ